MKVFISSVTHMLRDEREALPPFLGLLGHEALRFEDFAALNRSSREACLAGVDEADVYVLLLGPKYGDPIGDTGLSPTHEEFTRARQRGIPVLVFNKLVSEVDEPAQAAFKDEVGHYVQGRFWRSFTNPVTCNQAVGEALKVVVLPGRPLDRRRPAAPLEVPWLTSPSSVNPLSSTSGSSYAREQGLIPASIYAPVLELHLVAEGTPPYVGASELQRLAESLATDARRLRFVSEADPLVVGAAEGAAWAIRPPATERVHGSERRDERLRGLVARPGACAAFLAMPTDMMGALVNRQSLQDDLATLFALARPHVSGTAVAVAAGLLNAERVWDGDPQRLGFRNSGQMRLTQGATVRVGGDFVVDTDALATNFGDVGADLAAEILHDLTSLR